MPSAPDTVRDVLDEARNHLYRGHRDERNKLTTAVTADATSLTFTYEQGGIQPQAKLSIDLEDMYVWEATPSSATVDRGQFGTTAAAHAIGATISVNPYVSDAELFAALNRELAALSAEGLYRMATLDRTYGATVIGFDLVADFNEVHDLWWEDIGFTNDYHPITSYTVARQMPTSDFSSGTALLIYDAIRPGATIRVQYKAPFALVGSVADNVVDVTGIHPEALGLLAVGTALRVAAGKPVRRAMTEGQGSTRRAEEASTNDTISAPGPLRVLRRDLLAAETTRLTRRYPTRLKARAT